jgi:hypothetical protein
MLRGSGHAAPTSGHAPASGLGDSMARRLLVRLRLPGSDAAARSLVGWGCLSGTARSRSLVDNESARESASPPDGGYVRSGSGSPLYLG